MDGDEDKQIKMKKVVQRTPGKESNSSSKYAWLWDLKMTFRS